MKTRHTFRLNRKLLAYDQNMHQIKNFKGLFFIFSVLYLPVLNLPPLISGSTVSEDAGIEHRTVATSALAVRRYKLSARSHPLSAIVLIHSRLDLMHFRLDLIQSRLDLIHPRLDPIHSRLDLIRPSYLREIDGKLRSCIHG